MNIVVGVIIGFLILMALVVVHELGHFIAARRNGVTVEEFGIGFPPRAIAWVKNPEYEKWKKDKSGEKPKKWLRFPREDWDKKQKTLIFSLNYLPIGGFCAMKGESDSDTTPHSFGSASLWAKTKILFAGVTMNWLAAFIILTGLAITGMPEFMDNQFGITPTAKTTPAHISIKNVVENSPAEKAGLTSGEYIVWASSEKECLSDVCTPIKTTSDLTIFNNKHAGQTVYYGVAKDIHAEPDSTKENVRLVEATLNPTDAEYLLGITMEQDGMVRYIFPWYQAPVVAAVNTVQLTGETYRGLGNMVGSFFSGVTKQFSGDDATRSEGQKEIKAAGDSVSGPVGIIGILFPSSVESGPTTLAFLAAIISISLACMNVLPIPALDGGRFFLIMLYRLRGKKLEKATEEKIVSRAFIFLLILIVLVTIRDITRFF